MRRAAFFLIVGAIGAVLGWLFAGGARPEPPAMRVAEVAPVVPARGAPAAPKTAPAPVEASLADVISREFPPPEATGSETIHGKVLDDEERPEASILLVLEPELPEAGPSIADRLRREREFEARTRTAITDAEGRFAFEGLRAEGTYAIRRRPAGGFGGRRGIHPGATVELRTSRFFETSIKAAVRVTLGGHDVPRADLRTEPAGPSDLALRLGTGYVQRWTPTESEISVLGAGGRVRAFLDSEYASEIATVASSASIPVILELKPCPALLGRLDLPPMMEYAQLFVLPVEEGGKDAGGADFRKDGVKVDVVHGGFRLVGLPVGRYLFGLLLGDSSVLRTWEVEVRPGVNTETLALESISADDAITVTVTDPEGRGMEDIRSFGTRTELVRGTQSSGIQPIDAAGNRYRVRLRNVQLEALAAGRKSFLSVGDERWGSQEVELVNGQQEYVIAYPPQAELEIVIPGWLGSGLEGALDVTVYHESDAEEKRRWWQFEEPRPDFIGGARFRNLKPGPNVIEVLHTDTDFEEGTRAKAERSRMDSISAARHEGVLTAGPNRIEIPLPPIYTVEIVFPPEMAGKMYYFSREIAGGNHSAGNGFVTEHPTRLRLPPGKYSLSEGHGHFHVFTVDGDMRIEYRPGG